ncbi:MAG: phage tail assembly protein [Ruminococcaceae bacterium]|nr:phage tail assembly protein [Oscillospiraceae bacterium]
MAEKLEEKIVDEEIEDGGVYIHKLKKPFTWEGTTYEELTFDFDSLTGKDMELVELEMSREHFIAYAPDSSSTYMFRLAARAAKVHYSVIENLPLVEANTIRLKMKYFFLKLGF